MTPCKEDADTSKHAAMQHPSFSMIHITLIPSCHMSHVVSHPNQLSAELEALARHCLGPGLLVRARVEPGAQRGHLLQRPFVLGCHRVIGSCVNNVLAMSCDAIMC